jgi:hypothetical protein
VVPENPFRFKINDWRLLRQANSLKVKKLNLLEFTGSRSMNGQFLESGHEQDVTRRYIAVVNVVLGRSDRSAENPRFQ